MSRAGNVLGRPSSVAPSMGFSTGVFATFLLAFALALALALSAGAAPALALEVPYLAGRVTDEADLVGPEEEARIDALLAAFEERTGSQLAVLTIPSLEGESLEEYSLRVAETWGLGRAEEDDGVLFLVARDDRKVRIEVGYGLEGRLTDLESGRIIREVVVPSFRRGEFGPGIERGAEAIVATIEGDEAAVERLAPAPSGDDGGDSIFVILFGGMVMLVVFGSFLLSALTTRGCAGWFLTLFLMAFLIGIPNALLGSPLGPIVATVLVITLLVLRLVAVFTPQGRSLADRLPRDLSSRGWTTGGSGGFSGGGFSGGGFSGGGFSGGGGSFGGGGASGSW